MPAHDFVVQDCELCCGRVANAGLNIWGVP